MKISENQLMVLISMVECYSKLMKMVDKISFAPSIRNAQKIIKCIQKQQGQELKEVE